MHCSITHNFFEQSQSLIDQFATMCWRFRC